MAVEHALTTDERARFEADGYVMLANALDAARLRVLRGLAEQAFERFRSNGADPRSVLNLHDLIGSDDAYLELVDLPTTFPKVWGVLGWNIQLFHTQLVVTPPTDPAAPRGGYAWHQDNNRMNLDFETPPPHPRVSVKVGYFLSDVPQTGMGNFCVVPGSHRLGRPELAWGEQPSGAVEVTASAGDAILFDRRLWHAASTNHSSSTRIALFYGYSYRWLRPKSALQVPGIVERSDAIRRQLLGAASSANGYFDPTDDDVPLRAWARQHMGDEALPQ